MQGMKDSPRAVFFLLSSKPSSSMLLEMFSRMGEPSHFLEGQSATSRFYHELLLRP